jgi:hypothetical protein
MWRCRRQQKKKKKKRRRKSSRNVSFYECETRIFLLLHLAGFSNRRSNRKAASQRERERVSSAATAEAAASFVGGIFLCLE